MRIPRKALPLSFCLGLVLLSSTIAVAETPTPTQTSTATPSPTPSPQQTSVFQGQARLDAHTYPGPLTAKIGDVQCGEREPVAVSGGGGASLYRVSVISDEIKPGCGYEGAPVTFFLGDQQAHQTGIWHAGSFQLLSLAAGYPFAEFSGTLSTNGQLLSEILVPYMGDKPCGYGTSTWVGTGPHYSYSAIAYSNEQEPGCGVEGAEVTFKLLDTQGNVIAVAQEKGVWHSWGGTGSPQNANLTMVPVGGITLGNVGSGPGTGTDKASWVGLALFAFGLSGIAVGAALRRRSVH